MLLDEVHSGYLSSHSKEDEEKQSSSSPRADAGTAVPKRGSLFSSSSSLLNNNNNSNNPTATSLTSRTSLDLNENPSEPNHHRHYPTRSSRSKSQSSKSDERHSSLAPSDALLLDILRNTRKFPLSQREFQTYLEHEYAGELGHFIVDVEKYESLVGQSPVLARAKAGEIVDKYIRRGSEEEINISDGDRRAILGEESLNPKIFEDAKHEVIKMLQEPLAGFIREQTTTNLTRFEARRRLIGGIVLAILSVALIASLMWYQTVSAYPYNLRWWRVVAFPLILYAIGLYLSWRARLCATLARNCVKMNEQRDSWLVFSMLGFSEKRDKMDVVKDEAVRARMRRDGLMLRVNTTMLALVVMGVILVLPPGYNVPEGVP